MANVNEIFVKHIATYYAEGYDNGNCDKFSIFSLNNSSNFFFSFEDKNKKKNEK